MQSLNQLLALFFATSLVAASPVNFQRFEKRQDVEVVWVTVTSTDYITISTQTQFTQTITVQYSQTFSATSSGSDPVSSVVDPAVQDPVVAPTTPAPAADPAPATTATSADPPAVAAQVAPETPDPAPTATDPPATTADPPAAAPATVATPAAAASSSGSEDPPVDVMYSGQGTYFSPALGACGDNNSDTDLICAVSHDLFDSIPNGGNPNNSPLCGRKIQAYYGSNSVTVTLVDRCTACQEYDLDFSPAAFDQLAAESLGRIDITWEFIS